MDFQKVFTLGNSGSTNLYTCNGPATWIFTSNILILHCLLCFIGFGYIPIKSKLNPLILFTFHQVCVNFVEFFPRLKSLLKVCQILSLPNISVISLIMYLFFKIESLTYFSPLHYDVFWQIYNIYFYKFVSMYFPGVALCCFLFKFLYTLNWITLCKEILQYFFLHLEKSCILTKCII